MSKKKGWINKVHFSDEDGYKAGTFSHTKKNGTVVYKVNSVKSYAKYSKAVEEGE